MLGRGVCRRGGGGGGWGSVCREGEGGWGRGVFFFGGFCRGELGVRRLLGRVVGRSWGLCRGVGWGGEGGVGGFFWCLLGFGLLFLGVGEGGRGVG